MNWLHGSITITDAIHRRGGKHLKDVCQFNRQRAKEIYSKHKIAFQQMVSFVNEVLLPRQLERSNELLGSLRNGFLLFGFAGKRNNINFFGFYGMFWKYHSYHCSCEESFKPDSQSYPQNRRCQSWPLLLGRNSSSAVFWRRWNPSRPNQKAEIFGFSKLHVVVNGLFDRIETCDVLDDQHWEIYCIRTPSLQPGKSYKTGHVLGFSVRCSSLLDIFVFVVHRHRRKDLLHHFYSSILLYVVAGFYYGKLVNLP